MQKAQALADIFHSEDSDKIWGVIGPSDPRDAEFLAPIFHKENLITVGHGALSLSLSLSLCQLKLCLYSM